MTTIAVEQVQSSDVQGAFDLTAQHLGDTPTTEQQAIEMVQRALTEAGYPRAHHTPVFVKTHVKAKSLGKNPAYTADNASQIAKAIFSAATGAELPAAPEAPAAATPTAETAAPATSTPASTAPAAAAPGETSTPAAPETTAAPATTRKAAKVTDTATPSLIPAEIDQIANANAMVKNAIGSVLANASNKKFQKADALVKAFAKVDGYVRQANIAIAVAQTKLGLHVAGQHDEAAAIEVPTLDGFSATGLSDLAISDQDALSVDTILTMLTKNDSYTLKTALAALKSAEKVASDAVKSYRDIMSQIRKAAPKAKIAGGGAENGLPPYDVVMKMASEIFKDKAFQLPGEILEFEVPTFEWHGEVPDCVPDIDPTFRFNGEITATGLDAISENRIPWLFGESGCGKSEFWQQVAARLRMPFIRINLDSGVVRSDLIGRTTLKAGGQGMPITEFVDGVLSSGLQVPGIMLLDEFDCGDPEIMPVLQPVLEGKGLRVLEDGGRLVKQNPWCRIVITANTNGQGSANGAYLNVNEQSAATRNRIASWMEMPYLPESQEVQVVQERLPGIDVEFAKKLVQFASKARDAYRNAESTAIVSTRQVMEMARSYAKFVPLMKGKEEQCREWILSTKVYKSCDTKSLNVLRALATQIFA